MKKINIIQFLPYFPPHKGGLETVAEEFSFFYTKKGYGEVINMVFSVGQEEGVKEYEKDGYKVYIIPAFDIIPNFPVPKIWKKDFWRVFKIIKSKLNKSSNLQTIIQTHTRFFLSSLIGGLFAKKYKLKWIHIEHGSDYVKLGSKLKSKIAYLYDKTIGKWIFKKADKVVAISKACKKFVQNEFVKRDVEVIYRGICIKEEILKTNNFSKVENLKEKFPGKIIVGFVGRIFKWKNVDSLIKAYYSLEENIKNQIQIVIIGDGEELKNLKNLDKNNEIYFMGAKPFEDALYLQKQFDIHFHTSSPGGGLATTLLQAMQLGCFIIATPYEGANEIIKNGVNGILLEDDKIETFKNGILEALKKLDKKQEFSLKNKEIIKEKFDWNKNIEKYFNLYKSL